jgi:hypothetical protein
MACVPTLNVDVASVAVVTPAVVLSVPVPMLTPLSLNVTVPVGVPDAADTIAVKVTDWLKVDGFRELARVVVVATATATAVTALFCAFRLPLSPCNVVDALVLNQNCVDGEFAAMVTLVIADGGLQFEAEWNVAPAGTDDSATARAA